MKSHIQQNQTHIQNDDSIENHIRIDDMTWTQENKINFAKNDQCFSDHTKQLFKTHFRNL